MKWCDSLILGSKIGKVLKRTILSDLCRLLNVSSDLLLGLEYKNFTESNDAETQDIIFTKFRGLLGFGSDYLRYRSGSGFYRFSICRIDSGRKNANVKRRLSASHCKNYGWSALYRNPDASVEQLAEQVCIDIETPDNIAIFLAHRQ